MQPKRIRLTALLAVIATLTPTFGANLAFKAFAQPTLTQTSTTPTRVLAFYGESQRDAAQRLTKQGEAQLNRGEFQAAVESYRQAQQIYQELKQTNDAGAGEAFKGLGKAYLLLENYPQAIAIFRQLAQNGFAKEPALSNLGLALFRAGQLNVAEQTLREAIAGWESLRATERDDLNKVTLLEQQAYTYRLLQKVLVAQNKTDEALLVAEQARARSLVEQLVQNVGSKPQSPPTIDQIKQISKSTNSTLVEYSIVGSEIRVFGNEPTDETDLYIWVINPNGVISFRQIDLRKLENQSLTQVVYNTRQEGIGVRGRGLGVVSTNTQNSRTAVGTSISKIQQLYQLIIQPIADVLPKQTGDRVTFIPQGALFLVPFAGLPNTNGKYLIEQYTLVSAPSIQALALTQQQRQRLQGSVTQNALVIGNPTMPSIPTPGNNSLPLESLPGAAEEAVAVASLLNTQPLTGNQATKAAVLRLMPRASIIHLATHGLLDLDANLNELGEPLDKTAKTARESNVLVTPGAVIVGSNVTAGGVAAEVALAREKVVRPSMPGSLALAPSAGDNGFLTAKEILSLNLSKTELVVLSACNTGRGRITGEGVIGLSRAFIATGVPSVIVSLWAIPDAPTAFLMREFYRQLQQNPDKAQALRQAMLTTKKQFPEPKNWAAFTLIGEP
jgi:CHAT domain-containing protein